MENILDNLIPVLDVEDVVDTPIEESTPETLGATPEPTTDEVDDKETVDTTDDKESDEDAPEPSQAATLFYKELAANGIGKDDKDEYTFEDVNSLLNEYTSALPQQITEQIIESTPELGRKAVDYIFSKGADLTKDDLKSFVTTYLEDLSSDDIVIDSDETARQVLEAEYKGKFKPNVIEVMLDTLEDDGELQAEAKKLIESKPKKADQMLEQTKQEKIDAAKAQQDYINAINAQFDEFGWDKRLVSQLQSDFISGKTAKIFSEAGTHPKAMAQLINLGRYWDDKTKSFNFDKFIEKAGTKQAKSLKDKIEQDMFSSTPQTRSTKVTKENPLDGLVPIV